MEHFHRAKTVRLRSNHDKYLTAEEDEETVSQDRNGAAKSARWSVEFLENANNNVIRLKSCYGKYLTASNQPFLLGMTGQKVIQSLPRRLDSSVEWEPIRDGNQVKLRTRYGQFLRANGGLPPWRNSVTHDIPHRTSSQDWILWDVHVVDILLTQSPLPKPPSSPVSSKSPSFSRQESGDSLDILPTKISEGRLIYYHIITDDNGEIDEAVEELCISFKGNGVEELKKILEEETGHDDIIVCTRSVLNGKLYPLRLQLPPNNADMHVCLVPSSCKVAREFTEARIPL